MVLLQLRPKPHRLLDHDIFDTLERMLSKEEFDALPETEKECKQIYDALPWKKAIVVYIETQEGTK